MLLIVILWQFLIYKHLLHSCMHECNTMSTLKLFVVWRIVHLSCIPGKMPSLPRCASNLLRQHWCLPSWFGKNCSNRIFPSALVPPRTIFRALEESIGDQSIINESLDSYFHIAFPTLCINKKYHLFFFCGYLSDSWVYFWFCQIIMFTRFLCKVCVDKQYERIGYWKFLDVAIRTTVSNLSIWMLLQIFMGNKEKTPLLG